MVNFIPELLRKSWFGILCTHGCIISKVVSIKEKIQKCLPNKEYLTDHRHERTTITAKCSIIVTVA